MNPSITVFPKVDRQSVPLLTTEAMVEVDRLMIEKYQILLIQMMENAGRALAILAREYLRRTGERGNHKITVLAGTGGNGGGALVAARRLAAWGAEVSVHMTKPELVPASVPAHQLAILRSMPVKVSAETPAETKPDLILDGVIGYSLNGAPRGQAAQLIQWATRQSAPILSLDTPSGLDPTSGKAHNPRIEASATLTLALPKTGLDHSCVGALYLADISVPAELYSTYLGIEVGPLFTDSDIVQLC